LILNKIDLVPRENLEQWLKYFRNFYPTLAFKCSTHKNSKNWKKVSTQFLQKTEVYGPDSLIQLLKQYSLKDNQKTSISVGIIGYPNVGKSSIINSLKRNRKKNKNPVMVSATPGSTKIVQEVHLDKKVKLLDSPGIVFASGNNDSDLVIRNAIKINSIEDPISAVESILKRWPKDKVLSKYEISDFNTVQEFLARIAVKRGKIIRGGIINLDAAAKSIIQDWNSGKLPYYTIPPQNQLLKDFHLDAQVVSNWSKELDLENIYHLQDQNLNNQFSHIQQTNLDSFMKMEPIADQKSKDLMDVLELNQLKTVTEKEKEKENFEMEITTSSSTPIQEEEIIISKNKKK